MKCHVCGGTLDRIESDMPFKLDVHSVVVLKDLPVLQCDHCGEFLIEDHVMQRVDKLLERIDHDAELEVVRYAA